MGVGVDLRKSDRTSVVHSAVGVVVGAVGAVDTATVMDDSIAMRVGELTNKADVNETERHEQAFAKDHLSSTESPVQIAAYNPQGRLRPPDWARPWTKKGTEV